MWWRFIATAAGLDGVSAHIAGLARTCRFGDCRHDSERGSAILAAIAQGGLDPDRVKRRRKLAAEKAYDNESLAERRARRRLSARC